MREIPCLTRGGAGRCDGAKKVISMAKGGHLISPTRVGGLPDDWSGWSTSETFTRFDHSRVHSQSVLEAGEPKLVAVRGREVTQDSSFYQFVDEYAQDDTGEDLLEWLEGSPANGVVQVYTPGSSYCDLVKCSVNTLAETVMAKCLSRELYVQYGGRVRKLDMEDRPLHIQNEFLRSIGFEEHWRVQMEGISPELGPLFKFVTGMETLDGMEDQVQLSAVLKVKETGLVSLWTKRFCILIASKLFVFSSTTPKGKPSTTVALYGSVVEEYHHKKHGFGLSILQPQRNKTMFMVFGGLAEQSKWMKRMQKAVSKHPNEASFNASSLSKVPKYLFYNKDLSVLSLANNFLRERPSGMTRAELKADSPGYINDLAKFPRLNVLSLAFNNLCSFPMSLCHVTSLVELNLSGNQMQTLPPEICLLQSLRTLHLSANQLVVLPRSIVKLKFLSALVISFNEFDYLPKVLKDLSLLKVLSMAGNTVSTVTDDIRGMKNLEYLDMRLNGLTEEPPHCISLLPRLSRLYLSHNSLPQLTLSRYPALVTLNCSCNQLEEIELQEGPLCMLNARENRISRIKMSSVPLNITVLDVAKNALTSLPDGLCSMVHLERLDVSDNLLQALPDRIFVSLEKLKVLRASQNQLTVLPHEIGVVEVQELDLHCNKLVALPQWLLVKLSQLVVLNVSDNQLAALPCANPQLECNSLVEVYAGRNLLGNSVLEVVSQLKKLQILVLSQNSIESVPESSFHHLTSLRLLNLDGNQVTYLPPLDKCRNLQKLLLSSNRLTELPSFAALEKLREVDVSHNDLDSFVIPAGAGRQLEFLDISGNPHVEVSELSQATLKELSTVRHLVLDEIFAYDIPPELALAQQVAQPSHGAWTYGCTQVSGMSAEAPFGCTTCVVVPCVNKTDDLIIGVVDGGRSRDATSAVSTVLGDIVEEEYELQLEKRQGRQTSGNLGQHCVRKSTADEEERLQYLKQSVLSCHRKMGTIASRAGASLLVCHIARSRASGVIRLHSANTGLCEGVLGSEELVQLVPSHLLKTNERERKRVVELGASISEDFRWNDACAVSRLVGWYHLWPHLIPLPDVNEVTLELNDRFLVLATEQLWRVVSHAQAEEIISSSPSASCAARSLRDAALAYGCKGGISVAVLKFNKKKMEALLGSRPEKKPQSVRRSVSLRIPEDTHHYRLEVESPLSPSAYADELADEEVDDEVTDIDALGGSYGSPHNGDKWTCIDDPISPLTPPTGFADGFFFSTPTYHHAGDQTVEQHVLLDEEGASHGHSVDYIATEEREDSSLMDIVSGLYHSLPNLLDDDREEREGNESPCMANTVDL